MSMKVRGNDVKGWGVHDRDLGMAIRVCFFCIIMG